MHDARHLVSSRGVPGTAGPVVRDGDTRFLLCNHHVVFGEGASIGDPIFALAEPDRDRRILVGRGARGHLGRVMFGGEVVFVDCALIELVADATPSATGIAAADLGQLVHKAGAATGTTTGCVVDIAYADALQVGGRIVHTPRQLLIRSDDPTLNFCSHGDSGAAVVDHGGRVVGLLWGCNHSGQGVACPIEPVLDCLGVILELSQVGAHGEP